MARALTLELPGAVADELSSASARCERSVGFLVLGALKSSSALSGTPGTDRKPIELSTDDDDPADLASRVKKLAAEKAKGRSLDDAVALAWLERREQILAWVARVGKINEGERADDLDDGLRLAADVATPAAKLVELATSAYPRVRALVAAHPGAPKEALDLMGNDRERIVREALIARR